MRIFLTGGHGFVGTHVSALLRSQGHEVIAPTHDDGDLLDFRDTVIFSTLEESNPEAIIHLAARVGGIGLNRVKPATLWRENLLMGAEVLAICAEQRIRKLVMVGTACSYPAIPPEIPFREEHLFDGMPEPTNAAYGIAKRALIVGAEAYRKEFGLNVTTVIPTNLYGPGDNCDPDTSHVIPAIMRKMLEAKEASQQSIMLWGTGQATRDFLHVRDAARGIAAALTVDDPGPINLGSGCEIPIANLVEEIAEAVGYRGHWFYDQTKPDGQARRVLDISNARTILEWEPEIDFAAGLKETVKWMRSQVPA